MKEKTSVYVYIYLLICVCECIQTVFMNYAKKINWLDLLTSTSKCLSTVVQQPKGWQWMFVIKKHISTLLLLTVVWWWLTCFMHISLCPRLSFSVSVLPVFFSFAPSKCKMRSPPPTGHFTNVRRHKCTCVFSIGITRHPITGLYTSPLALSSWCHRVCRACKRVA